MKGISTFVASTVVFSLCADAINLQKRADGAPARVIGFPVERKAVSDPVVRDRIRRRSETVQTTLDNKETLYFANATLGTPAQSLRLHIDTGSSDLWVNTPSSTFCKSMGNACASSGTYSANSSSTYNYIASNFNISYVDGSGASGDYVTDTFTISGTTLSSLQFGIGYVSSSGQGILGIGYQINEVEVNRAGNSAYNNLPAQMVADDMIHSNAYSLWLNDLDASTGQILFGGVDTAQYTGTLETLPVQKSNGLYSEFLITLTDISFAGSSIASNQAVAVLLDSGSSLTYLPNAMTQAIYQQVSAFYNSNEDAAYVDCSLANNDSTIDFKFSTPTISVAMRELVLETVGSNGEPLTLPNGRQACLFGIAPAGNSNSVLGDTFLRSAYVVYDLANNEISLASTNFNATSTNIMEIGTGTSSVPDATLVANPATASSGTDGGDAPGAVTLGKNAAPAIGVPSLAAIVMLSVVAAWAAC